MLPYLLMDFGSTYTKMTAVDLDGPGVLGTSRALTTVQDGLTVGYEKALHQLQLKIGKRGFVKKLACSSAAGGLKLAAIGLVPELTVTAAKQAALGAGARVVKTYGFQLTPDEVRELEGLKPDLILMAGGTDGGNRETLLHNARMLSQSNLSIPMIIAGNKAAAAEAEKILASGGKICRRVANVLPGLDVLNIEPAQRAIRELFLERIIHAKGLDQVEKMIDGIMMPTPAAALAAARLLADGAGPDNPGLGELLVVDVGGATTDIHSVAKGDPSNPQVCLRGLPEPVVKRTVEGDLGMRYSAPALLEVYTPAVVARLADLTESEVVARVEQRVRQIDYQPLDEKDWCLEKTIAFLAVQGATERHAGRVEKVYTPQGISYLQVGKDLLKVQNVIGTGGVLADSRYGRDILQGALADPAKPELLKPQDPQLFIDGDYLLPTLGLIAEEFPAETLALLKGSLINVT